MEYQNNQCLGCGNIVEVGVCPNCPPGTGKVLDSLTSVPIQVLPTPKPNRFKCKALEASTEENQRPVEILEFISGNTSKIIEKLQKRYKHVNSAQSLGLLFEEKYTVEHIIKPVKQAHANYLLGNWIACISTCGIASECLTILIWRMTQVEVSVKINGSASQDTAKIYAIDLEDYTQKDRINYLANLDLITDKQKEDLHKIRDWRNDYVHYSKTVENDTQAEAAREVFNLTIKLIEAFMTMPVKDGKIQLSQQLSNYIARVSSNSSQA